MFFYIFTIITNGTHQIVIFRMTPTYIPAVRSFTYKFTTFTHVAATAAGNTGAESAGPLRRAPIVTTRWAQPPAANPIPLDPPPPYSSSYFFLLPCSHRRRLQLPSCRPCATVAMSHRAESSSASRSVRRQERGASSMRTHAVAYPTGKEPELPLIECPNCNVARVIELCAKKDTPSNGRTFFKCPRNGVSVSIPQCFFF